MNFLLILFTFFKAANDYSPKQKALLDTISTVSLIVGGLGAIAFFIIVLPPSFYPLLSLLMAVSLVVYFAYIMYTINLDKYKHEERLKENERK